MPNKTTAPVETYNRLRNYFPKGSSVYVSLKWASSNGTGKIFSVYGVKNNEIVDLDSLVASALGRTIKDTRTTAPGIYMRNGTYDDLVMEISYALYGDEYQLKRVSL